jgi:tRNA-specific 2-thiouridylase
MPKALIAMSGGVDSSVAAYLMKKAGYRCIGATMKLFHNEAIGVGRNRACCSLDDVEDARGVAYRLGIPYYVFNFSDDFEQQVISRFIRAYERGATPNPCIDCNRYLKFERLYQRAAELGCAYVATGHYARIEQRGNRFLLKKALDSGKDQSYVLYAMTQEQLAHTVFPCGELSKAQTRKIADKEGFLNADKPDSQDICFVPDGDYAAFIERYSGKKYPPGEFIDASNTVIGRHNGLIHYTIGQRKGLGISAPQPLYVTEIDTEHNQVRLDKNQALFTHELDAGDFNWIAFENPPRHFCAKARIRYRQEEMSVAVDVLPNGGVHLCFDEPQRAVTKGQAVVLYDEDNVLGGGTILS